MSKVKKKKWVRPSRSKQAKADRTGLPIPKTNTVLTMKLIRQFIKEVKRGLPADGVCDYLGIHSTTFWDWTTRGTKYLLGSNKQEDALCAVFVQRFRKATAIYRKKLVRELHKPYNENWRQQLTILERRDRKTFGRTDPAGSTEAEYDPDERFL